MIVAEVSVVPLGTSSPSVSQHVARAIEVLQQERGIQYQLTPMCTLIQGEWDAVLAAVKKMHHSLLEHGVLRVLTTIKIDERRDKELTLRSKLQSVQEKLHGQTARPMGT